MAPRPPADEPRGPRSAVALTLVALACGPVRVHSTRPAGARSAVLAAPARDASELDAPAADDAVAVTTPRAATPEPLPYPWWTAPAPAERASIARMPELPLQRAPWSVPRETGLTRTARFYFDHGLPDPRGLAYVRATVEYGAGVRSARGWRVPAQPGRSRELLLTWSGLLLDAESVEGPADVRADAAPVLRAITADRDGPEPAGPRDALAPQRFSYVTMMYLARLGLLGAWEPAHFRRRPSIDGRTVGDAAWATYLREHVSQPVHYNLASEAASLFVQGHFDEALRTAHTLRLACDGFESARRDAPSAVSPGWWCEVAEPLEAECARRARGIQRPAPAADPARERVVSRVVGLEDARGRSLEYAPRSCFETRGACAPLFELGEAGVDALIDAYEDDTRMTRVLVSPVGSLHFPPPRPMRVYELARAALNDLLGVDIEDQISASLELDPDSARAARASVLRERRSRGELRAREPGWYRPSRDEGAP